MWVCKPEPCEQAVAQAGQCAVRGAKGVPHKASGPPGRTWRARWSQPPCCQRDWLARGSGCQCWCEVATGARKGAGGGCWSDSGRLASAAFDVCGDDEARVPRTSPKSRLGHLSSSDRGFTLSVVRMDAVFDLNRSSYLNLNNSFTAKTIF